MNGHTDAVVVSLRGVDANTNNEAPQHAREEGDAP